MEKFGKKIKITCFVLLFLTIIELFYVCFLPKVINIEGKIPFIEAEFHKFTGLNIEIKKPKIKTYPDFSISLHADETGIFTEKKEVIFHTFKPFVKIKPFSLLLRKVKIDEVKTTKFYIDLTPVQDFLYKNNFKNLDTQKELPFDIDANKTQIEIDGYQILLKDKHLNKTVSLSGTVFDLVPITRNLSKLTTDGVFDIDGEKTAFNLNIVSKFLFKRKKTDFNGYSAIGFIENINLDAIAPYLNKFSDYKNAKGKINIKFNTSINKDKKQTVEITSLIKDVSINEGDFEHQIIAKGENRLTIKGNAHGKTLNINELKFYGENFGIYGAGKIQNYTKSTPVINLSFTLTPSSVKDIVDLLPFNLCKEINLVKKHGISGDLTGAINILGKIPKPKLYGNAEARNVHALRGRENSHIGEIFLKFEGKSIFPTVKLKTSNGQTFLLNGKAQLYDEDWSIFDIQTSEKLDLKLVCDILTPVSRIFNFETGPVPFLAIKSGNGNAKMHIKGTKREAYIDGYVNVKDANGTFNGINVQLSNANVRVDFQGKNIKYETKHLRANNYPVQIYGTATTSGLLNFNIKSDLIKTNTLKNILKTSPLLAEKSSAIDQIEKADGMSKFLVNLSGVFERGKDFVKNSKNLKMQGVLNLKDNNITLKGYKVPIFVKSGKINFTDSEISSDNLAAKIGKSDININFNGKLAENKTSSGRIIITSPSMFVEDSLNFITNSELLNGAKTPKNKKISGKHTLNLFIEIKNNNINLKSINGQIKIINTQNPNSLLNVSSGDIQIKNENLAIKNLLIQAEKSKLNISGQIKNYTAKKPIYDIYAKGSNISVKTITELSELFPKEIKKAVQSCKEYGGFADISLNLTNRGITGFVKFKELTLRHIKSDIPCYFEELPIKFTNSTIKFDKISGELGRTGKFPFFADASINNYMKIPYIKANAAMKPTTIFVERYINTKLSHPIKMSGDIGVFSEINGSLDSVRFLTTVKINKDSDISYLTVNLGDNNLLREIKTDIFLKPNGLFVKKAEYLKHQISEGGKIYQVPMWNLTANCQKAKNGYILDYATFLTHQKQPAKILNFIFKKSIIKDGKMSCNLRYSKKNNIAKVLGSAEIYNVEIPTYNIRISEGSLLADNSDININAKGNIIDTDFNINTKASNAITMPIKVKNANIKTTRLNLERLADAFQKWSIDAYSNAALKTKVNMDISDIIIEKGLLEAKQIEFKTCPMQNFKAEFSLDKNSELNVFAKDFKMTGGDVSGNIKYLFKNGKTEGKLSVKGIDSNGAAESFLGLKEQISGSLDGEAIFKTKGLSDLQRLKNFNGKITFNVKDGNMTKLGSLEYLLRASNIIYSGLTTLSVNNFIELLKPFKQGSFSTITGKMDINNGIVDNIAIYSQGKNMSLYINGKYDIEDVNADITVYGKLGKKTNSIFGPIGNLSANTLFSIIPREKDTKIYDKNISKIPDIEYKNDSIKVFRATIQGNINENDTAGTFKWIK